MNVHGANRSTSHDGIVQKIVVLFRYSFKVKHPIESMYGIFTYIWLILMVNYGKCSSKYIPYMDSMSMVKSNISKKISPRRPEEHLPPPKRQKCISPLFTMTRPSNLWCGNLHWPHPTLESKLAETRCHQVQMIHQVSHATKTWPYFPLRSLKINGWNIIPWRFG